MPRRAMWLLPYVEVDRTVSVGSLRFERLKRAASYARLRSRVFYDRAGRPITPTVASCIGSAYTSAYTETAKLDLTLQAILYGIFDQRVLVRKLDFGRQVYPDPLEAFLHRGRQRALPSIDGVVFRLIVEAQPYDNYEFMGDDSDRRGREKTKEYAPGYVEVWRLKISKILAVPICSALLRCLNDGELRSYLTAVKWFNLSCSKNPLLNPSQKLLFRCTAFEALLSLPREAKVKTFCYALRSLIPHLHGDRLDKWAALFYQKRSEVVHTGQEVSVRIKSKEKGKEYEYGSEFALSEIVFNMCLKQRLALEGVGEYAREERSLLDLRLDFWLMANKERLAEIRTYKVDDLLEDAGRAYRFLRLVESVNFEDRELDDGDVLDTMHMLKRTAEELMKRMLGELELTDKEKAGVTKDMELISVLDLSYRPDDDDDENLPVPGYPSEWRGGSFGYEGHRRRWEARMWEMRSVAELQRESRGTEKEGAFLQYYPYPHVSIYDLCCALQTLNELRKVLNPSD